MRKSLVSVACALHHAAVRTIHTTPLHRARLAVVRPDVAAEWVPEMNEDADISKVEVDWDLVAWWRCQNCGFQWQSSVRQRAQREHGCPQCAPAPSLTTESIDTMLKQQHEEDGSSSRNVVDVARSGDVTSAANSVRLLDSHPAVAARWHPTLNGGLRPVDVTAASSLVVWWAPESDKEQPFQRSIDRFAKDMRSDAQIAKDQADVEQQILRELEEVANVPPAIVQGYNIAAQEAASANEQRQKNGEVYLSPDQNDAVLRALLDGTRNVTSSSSATPHAPNVLQLLSDPKKFRNDPTNKTVFHKQPIVQTDAALRQKTLQFYIQSILDFKSSGDESATTMSASRVGVGSIPSYALDDKEAWLRYFTVAKDDAANCWRSKLLFPSAAAGRHEYLKESMEVGSREGTVGTVSSPRKEEGDVASLPTSEVPPPAATAPRVPRKVGLPRASVQAAAEEAAVPPPPVATTAAATDSRRYPRKPRMTRQHADEQQFMTGATQQRNASQTDSRYVSQREVDLLAEAREAALQFDTLSSDADTVGASGADVLELINEKPQQPQQYQRPRQTGAYRRPRIALEMPSDDSSASAATTAASTHGAQQPSSTPSVAVPLTVPNVAPSGPRKVARPRRVQQQE